RMRWTMVGACFGLLGCELDHTRVVSLAEMPALQVWITPYRNNASVDLEYEDFKLGSCASISPGFTATLDGAPLRIADPGSWDAMDEECQVPSLNISAAATGPGALVIADESLTFTAELGDLLRSRSASLVSKAQWTFAPSEQVTIQWSPAS